MTLAATWKRLQSRTGRLFKSDGTVFQEADYGAFKENYDVQRATIGRSAAEASALFTIPGNGTYNIGFYPPEGRALIIWYREIPLPEGTYELEVVNAEWDVATGTEMTTAPLDDECECVIESDIRHGVTITGAETRRRITRVDIGNNQGLNRPPASQNSDAAFRRITKPTVLKLTKTSADDALSSCLYTIWEEDI